MEVIVLFVLLCLSINNGYGITQTSNEYMNQTWNEASNDSSCSLIGLNLTGEIEENVENVTSSFALYTHQTAWIGAYAKRFWINFEGCYFGTFKNNDSWMTLMSHEDPAKSCLRHCNYSGFVLAEDKCVCYKDVSDLKSGCIAMTCVNTKYRYCGKGTALSTDNITFRCMCRFSMENDLSLTSDTGNCLAVTYEPQLKRITMNCSYTYRPICNTPESNQVDISGSSNNWLQSMAECYANNKQFASGTTNLTGIHNGTYWVGTFAVTYKLWGRPHTTNNSCVAVHTDITSNHLTTVVLPCDTLLPALCMNTSISNKHTEVTTECSSYKHPSTTYPQQISRIQDTSTAVLRSLVTKINESVTSPVSKNTPTDSSDGSNDQTDMLTEGEHKSPVPLIVGSIVGGVVGVAIFVAVVSFLCRRRAFRKRSTETDISLSKVEDQISSYINYRDANADTIPVNPGENVYENSDKCKTNGAETPEEGGYTEPHRYVSQGTTGSGVYINDAAMYQPELFAQQNPENPYCGLSLPSHDEHEYGHLK